MTLSPDRAALQRAPEPAADRRAQPARTVPRATRRLLLLAWTLTLCSLASFIGSSWDIQWHAAVGRDSFLTPPHVLMYISIGLTGLVCLFYVCAQTLRYHRGDQALSAGTTRILWLFHAPLGAIMAGFGVLAVAISAPLDTLWHQLYGIDVTLWAPFHVMGISGSIIVGLGTLYLFAQASASAPAAARRFLGFSGAELGLLLRASLVLAVALILAIPALEDAPFLNLAGLVIAIHPLLVALVVPVLMVAALQVTERIGAATLVGLGFSLLRLLVSLVVPQAVALLVEIQGVAYRPSAPAFTAVEVALPASLLATGLLIDGALLLARRRGRSPWGAQRMILAAALAMGFTSIAEPLWRSLRFADVLEPAQAAVAAAQVQPAVLLPTALLALGVAAAGVWLGMGFGRSLKLIKE